MRKYYSVKFWILFWCISALFLTGWYFFWISRNQSVGKAVSGALDFLPIDNAQKKDYQSVAEISDYLMKKDGQQKTILILFQNNLEIRPGGGFIGSFGILKIKDGQILSLETHDLSNFDARIPDSIVPPYPMQETLKIKSWKLRDSNYSPDFEVNARKAQEFYYLGQGQEQFNGVIGITANVLSSILKITGPIQIEGYPGTYDSNNAIISLEYQVEKAFEEQGIGRGERKSVMNDLAKEIEKRIFTLSTSQKLDLAKVLLDDLNKKDIQLYFKDADMQRMIESSGWSGTVDQNWQENYLMTVDANLGAFKSDYYVKRSLLYAVDLRPEKPTVNLKITYDHTAKQKDWMTKDYLSYLRIYVPENSWLGETKNFEGVKFGTELEKKYFGAIIKVPIGTTRTIELNYTLPKEIKERGYDLKIQKQAGINNEPVKIKVIYPDGSEKNYEKALNSDIIFSELNF